VGAPQYTGSDDDLFPILDAAWAGGCELGRLDKGALLAWRDAAIARFLAEAGAVHPQVHTPNRVQQWLSEHGWQPAAQASPGQVPAAWIHADSRQAVFVHVDADDVNYAGHTAFVVAEAAAAADLVVPEALLEIALLPDEVAW
jgi:hypothetical protein